MLSPKTRVTLDDRVGKLEDIRPNIPVICVLSPDRRLVELIQIVKK